MNKLMRKFSVSILVVIFAIIALGATTFAWFTVSNTGKVNQFEVDVVSKDGIEISMDASNWSETISPTVPSAIKLDGITWKGSSFKKLSQTSPITVAGESKAWNYNDAPNNSYAVIRFFVRGVRAESIKVSGFTITNSARTWKPDLTFTPSNADAAVTPASEAIAINIADAARISFAGAPLAAASVSNATASYPTLGNKVIVENATAGTNKAGFSSLEEGGTTIKGAMDYWRVKKNIAISAWPTLETTYTTYTSANIADAASLVTLAAPTTTDGYYYGMIEVHVWLEGWDSECYNALFGDKLFVSFIVTK